MLNNLVECSPIQRLKEDLNGNSYFIKREDLIGFSFGGNKARKSALFFEDIKAKKADCIVTYGSSSSNHCRIVSNLAAANKISCYIISPVENSNETFNSRLIKIFGANVIYCNVNEVKDTIDRTIVQLKNKGYNPYFIQGGGHGNIGTQAYVNVYQEIKKYEEQNKINIDYIFHASGTGTTQAGLVCGKIINQDSKKIIGISIARRNPYGTQVVLNSVNDYLKASNYKTIDSSEVIFVDEYIVDGYGTYNKYIISTIKNVLMNEGIPLDTTYTGKAYWGMCEYIKKNNITGNNILFIHTGGTPLFFNNMEELNNGR